MTMFNDLKLFPPSPTTQFRHFSLFIYMTLNEYLHNKWISILFPIARDTICAYIHNRSSTSKQKQAFSREMEKKEKREMLLNSALLIIVCIKLQPHQPPCSPRSTLPYHPFLFSRYTLLTVMRYDMRKNHHHDASTRLDLMEKICWMFVLQIIFYAHELWRDSGKLFLHERKRFITSTN